MGRRWRAVYGSINGADEGTELRQGKPKKRVTAQLLSDDDNEDGFEKGCALIQAVLGVRAEDLTEEEWARYYARAVWLENDRLKRQAELLSALFGGKEKEG